MEEGNTVYPCFSDHNIRKSYSNKINEIFNIKDINWVASPALISQNVFVKPKIPAENTPLNTEALPFDNVARISLQSNENGFRLSLITYPSMKTSKIGYQLEKKGYSYESIDKRSFLSFLAKPLERLESIAEEIKEIEPILYKGNSEEHTKDL